MHLQFDIQNELPGAKAAYHYDRPLRKGTILGIDTGAFVGMYTLDYPRMVSLGPATDAQKRLYASLLEANRKMAQALRPGITVLFPALSRGIAPRFDRIIPSTDFLG